jgi:hypothetical protein
MAVNCGVNLKSGGNESPAPAPIFAVGLLGAGDCVLGSFGDAEFDHAFGRLNLAATAAL